EDVAIFWDYENCPAPTNASGYALVNNIRSVAQPYGSVKSLRAYLGITEHFPVLRALTLRSELQSSGVSLVDCPHNGRKDVADKMIIVDMLAHAIDNPAPSTIVLITGDRDFAYAMSILRLRRYRIILLTLPNAHSSLTAQASICMDW
ncbi:limkain-b1-type NYN domain-containing protein, partial [Flammula alnicola]